MNDRGRVLVTGACGRIGRRTVRELRAAGYEVVGLDARPPHDPELGVRFVTRRLEDLQPGDPELRDLHAVVHLGALMSWDDQRAEAMMSANVTGTFRLLEATCPQSLSRFVFASSGEVYPEMAPQYVPLDEHHPRRPGSYYGMTKLLGEDLVAFYERYRDVPAVVLRFSHVQDPDEILDPESFFSGPRFFLHRRLERERVRGNSELVEQLAALEDGSEQLIAAHRSDGVPVRMGILAAADMAIAIRLALEAPQAVGQVIGVGPDESADLAEFAYALGAAADLPVVDVTVPSTAASYWTVNCRARELLGFRVATPYPDMIAQAAAARRARLGAPL